VTVYAADDPLMAERATDDGHAELAPVLRLVKFGWDSRDHLRDVGRRVEARPDCVGQAVLRRHHRRLPGDHPRGRMR
jgi:hypothetical protein